MKKLLLVLVLFAAFFKLHAQYVTVETRITYLFINYDVDPGKSYGGRFRINFNNTYISYFNQDNGCVKTPWDQKYYVENGDRRLSNVSIDVNSTFSITMTSHHERKEGSDDCTVQDVSGITTRRPDLHEITNSLGGLQCKNYPPGVWSNVGEIVNTDGNTWARAKFEIKYSVPKPVTPKYSHTTVPNLTNFCADKEFKLSTDVLPNSTGLKYNWEYLKQSDVYNIFNPILNNAWNMQLQACGHYEGGVFIYGSCPYTEYNAQGVCGYYEYYDNGNPLRTNSRLPINSSFFVQSPDGLCSPDSIAIETWNTLPTANPTDKTITVTSPVNSIFNNTISNNEVVSFRVTAKSADNALSPLSSIINYTFLPPAASLIEANIIKEKSCGNPYNGKIILNPNAFNAKADFIRWILKPGFDNTASCSIDINGGSIGSNCGLDAISSNGPVKVPRTVRVNGVFVPDPPLVIDGLAPGKYTLWLINAGGSYGYCYNTTNIEILKYDSLTIDNIVKTDVSCAGNNDGTIIVKAIGGKPDGYTFKVTALNNTSYSAIFPSSPNNTMNVTGLKADKYTVELINTCKLNGGINPTVTIEIKEPIKVTGNIIATQPTCSNPANGSIVVNATTGNAKYTYNIYKDGSLLESVDNDPLTSHTFNNLLSGNYNIKLLDAERKTCAGFDTTVTINAPPAIVISKLLKDSVSCFGGNDGKITIEATGSTGNLTYALQNNTTNDIFNSDAGVFTNLVAGLYTILVNNKATTGCNDSKAENIDILQRPEVNIAIENNNVTCNGNGDGKLKAVITGGSGSFSYAWKKMVAGNWQDYGVNSLSLTGVEPGTYRLEVKDNNANLPCATKNTNDIVITEPNELMISDIQVSNAPCFGDVTNITVITQGGNGNDTYEYNFNNSGNWMPFTSTTSFANTGSYAIKATDSKGCTKEYTTPILLTFATSAINFTEVLSDYNGLNISCFGGNNGKATITANGGQAPYQYALDNNAYQTSNELVNINAGIHILKVKDARGCVKQKELLFTQSASEISVSTTSIIGVQCASDNNGSIAVNASGGAGTFSYSINDGALQTSNVFNNLTADTYIIKAFDINNCSKSISVTVPSLNPPIVINSKDIKNVSCYGGNDGSITLNAAGGSGLLTYVWQGSNNTTNNLSGVKAGAYSVKITDALGCYKTDITDIKQPNLLTLNYTTEPLCAGNANAAIALQATGGVMPYSYSINNGMNYSSSPNFTNIDEGVYQLKIKDSNLCEASQTLKIKAINTKPSANFIVASRQNERDTLVIKEICFPSSDNVTYTYHPDAIVLPNVNGYPSIKFNTVGSYWIEMTATYGICKYTLRKNIEIKPYDPNAGPNNILPIKVIESIKISPNPNNGQFNLAVLLNRKQRIQIKIQNLITSAVVYQKNYDRTLATNDQIVLPNNIASGTYVVRVITENDSRDMMMVMEK